MIPNFAFDKDEHRSNNVLFVIPNFLYASSTTRGLAPGGGEQ